MAYSILAYNVRRLAADTTTGLPGGLVTLQLPDADVPATGLVLLIDAVDLVCAQDFPAAPCNLFDIDPTQGGSPAPCATTRFGNADEGEAPSGIVIPSGANLWIQWSNVNPGVIPAARVQFRLAEQVNAPGGQSSPTSHPILGS